MTNHEFSQLTDHLEYFGYSIEDLDDGNAYKATHEAYGNVFIRPMGHQFLHSNYWMISEKASSEDLQLLKIINRLNQSNYVSTYSVMDDGGLRIDAVYTGEYTKFSYGEFVDYFQKDIVRIMGDDDELRNYREQSKLELVN